MAGVLPEPKQLTPATAERRRRVLFICADPVGDEMAGLGIRNWELAQVLRQHADVTVAHGGSESRNEDGLRTEPYRPHAPHVLKPLIAGADVVVAHPQWPLVTRWLRRSSARVIFDMYDPETLETLELLVGRPPIARRLLTATTLDRLHDSLCVGHHFMCAAENQRDLWLGAMLALRLIGPDSYDRDPTLRSVIDVVPFGLPDRPPERTGHGPREQFPQLGSDDELVLWNGGIWHWLDAPTAIRAIAIVAQRRPGVRLVFMAAAADRPAAAQSVRIARDMARELGILGSSVIFHEGWVPYAERADWLAQAGCALSCARDHLETRFAFRTRLLDCLWAGLPIVCTTGDDMAARVAREGLGEVASTGDHHGVAEAIERVLNRGRAAYAERLAAAASQLRWSRVARALIGWSGEQSAPMRLGDVGTALARPPAQRARELAYLHLARPVLARMDRG
jgi:glycosyltransferase involved in cell wall biosynthesis